MNIIQWGKYGTLCPLNYSKELGQTGYRASLTVKIRKLFVLTSELTSRCLAVQNYNLFAKSQQLQKHRPANLYLP